jgi:hypothetical protein
MNHEPQPASELGLEEIRALLAARLLEVAEEASSLPVSPAQERLWFLDQLAPGSPLYNIPCVAFLAGQLDLPALEQTMNTIVARHESLRTRFFSRDGEPAQVIDSEADFEMERVNLEDRLPAERERAAQHFIENEVKRPFNLQDDRLIRVTLMRLGAEDHVLIVNMHHIISDEWSFKLFFKELKQLYTGLVTGKPVALPELPIQYSDYAAWQREWIGSEDFQHQLEFWKEQLAGNPRGVELPTDHPRRPGGNAKGAVLVKLFGPDLTRRLEALAQREGVTLFMVLLTAFKALLHRHTGQEDIIVGSPMAGRSRVETEEVIGFFANTLPLRTRVNGEMTFKQLLTQAREVALGAYSNQELPFEKLVEALQPERSPGRMPYINALFIFQNQFEWFDLPGLKITFLDVATDTAKFDVTLWIAETELGLTGGFEYDADLFEARTMTVLLDHFESLLHGVAADAHQPLSALPLLTDADRTTPLPKWTVPEEQAPRWQFLEQWFEARVRRIAGGQVRWSGSAAGSEASPEARLPAIK